MKRLPMPKLSADEVSLCNRLIGRCRDLSTPIGKDDFRLHFTFHPTAANPSATVLLRVDVGRLPAWIGLSRIGDFGPLADLLGDADLADLPAEVQTAALSALLEPALDRLADACGEEATVGQVNPPDGPDDAALRVGFCLTCDGRPAVHGHIAFASELMPAILALADRAPAVRRNDLADMPVAAAVEVGRASLPLCRLRTLAPFDVVLMDAAALREDAQHRVRMALPRALSYQGVLEESRLSIEKVEPWAPLEPLEDDSAVAAEDAPVELTFDMGEVWLPLGQWAALGPGMDVPFTRSQKQRLGVRVGGRLIGRAEAVRVGHRAGARLLDWAARPDMP